MVKCAITLGLAVCAGARAELIVLPPSSANTPTPLGLNTLMRTQGRTFQQLIPGAALASGGNVLTGFTTRTAPFSINSTPLVPWPPAPISFGDYEIRIGEFAGAAGSGLSATFAENIVAGTELLVRDGPMTVPAGSWVLSGTGFGAFEFVFDAPFTFDPTGTYVMTVRHTGSGATQAPVEYWFEGAATTSVYQGAVVGTSATATQGLDQGMYLVTRWTVIPAPGAGVAAGLALLGLARRRR